MPDFDQRQQSIQTQTNIGGGVTGPVVSGSAEQITINNYYGAIDAAPPPADAPTPADMPVDHLPAVASLPPGSRMIHRRNPLFTGRAVDLLVLALEIREAVLGERHPDMAQSLNNLGYLLQAQGDLVGAQPYYQRALAILTERLGPDHPDTRTVRGNLAAMA